MSWYIHGYRWICCSAKRWATSTPAHPPSSVRIVQMAGGSSMPIYLSRCRRVWAITRLSCTLAVTTVICGVPVAVCCCFSPLDPHLLPPASRQTGAPSAPARFPVLSCCVCFSARAKYRTRDLGTAKPGVLCLIFRQPLRYFAFFCELHCPRLPVQRSGVLLCSTLAPSS